MSIVNGQVWLPNNMVKMGEKARANTFPHPPRAFNLPAPPPPTIAQLRAAALVILLRGPPRDQRRRARLSAGGVAEGHTRLAVGHTYFWRAHPTTTVLFFPSDLTSYANSYRAPGRVITGLAVCGSGNFTRIFKWPIKDSKSIKAELKLMGIV